MLIWSELKLLPPDHDSVGVSVLTTAPPDGEIGVGETGVAACVEKYASVLVTHVPVPFAPEQAVTSQR
jgi:hypothetical protein